MHASETRSWAERVIAFKRTVPQGDTTWHTLGAYTDRRPAGDRLFALRLTFRGDGLVFRARKQVGGTRIEIQVRWAGNTSAAGGDRGATTLPAVEDNTHGGE